MKNSAKFIFFLIVFFLKISNYNHGQPTISTLRSIKTKNQKRIGIQRSLNDSSFLQNPLLYGVDTKTMIGKKSAVSADVNDILEEVNTYQDHLEDLGRLIFGVKAKMMQVQDNLHERVSNMNQMVLGQFWDNSTI